jgi:proteasome lid subunit RPN8/RPN11
MIDASLLAELYAHACEAFPHECCGYIIRSPDEVVRCTNAAAEPATSFAIDGAELLAFVRRFDGARPPTAVYHSHTNGRAYLSPRDVAVATTAIGPVYPVAHVVVGVTAAGVTEVAVFGWDGASYAEVARFRPC